jgi:hypothetical protein
VLVRARRIVAQTTAPPRPSRPPLPAPPPDGGWAEIVTDTRQRRRW